MEAPLFTKEAGVEIYSNFLIWFQSVASCVECRAGEALPCALGFCLFSCTSLFKLCPRGRVGYRLGVSCSATSHARAGRPILTQRQRMEGAAHHLQGRDDVCAAAGAQLDVLDGRPAGAGRGCS